MDSNHGGDKQDRGVLKPHVYFSNNRSLGIKWNFYFFAAFLKNGMHSSLHTQAAWFVCHYITAIYPTMYTLVACLMDDGSLEGRENYIFPGSNFLSYITPGFFSTSVFFAIVFVLMLLIDLFFILCVFVPRFAFTYIRIIAALQLFNVRVHMAFLPFVCAVLRYCLTMIVYWEDTSPEWRVLSVVFLFVFVVFMVTCCLLHFLESNSIINPSLMYEEWFSGAGFFAPLLVVIVSLAGFGALHMTLKTAMGVLLSIALICFAVAVFTIVSMPMMMFLANELFATKMLVKAYGLIMSALTLYFQVPNAMVFLFGAPLWLILAFAVIHLILETRRRNARKLILQIETEEDQMTTTSLDITLSSVDKNQFQLLVKESLLSGSRAVISPIFVRFCLERFRNSEWFLSYVVFLFSVIWGGEPEVYKFLLHLLSVDEFGITTQLVIFQFVYAFMQISKDVSPIIDRNINHYQKIVCEFIEAHRNFWRAASQGDTEAFDTSFAQLVDSFSRMESMIFSLETVFGYCPAVHRERSIFYADFKHNVEKGHASYKQAMRLTDAKTVTSSLFFGFSKFFHMPQDHQGTKDELEVSDKYIFLSLREVYEDSTKHLKVSDISTGAGTKVFEMQRDKPRIKPVVDKRTNVLLLVVEVLALIVYFLCFIGSHFTTKTLKARASEYYSIQYAINQTLEFRNKVSQVRNDLIILKSIFDETWQETDEFSELFSLFVKVHLDKVKNSMVEFRGVVDDIVAEGLVDVPEVDNCADARCSFSSCASLLYGICDYFQGGMTSYKIEEVAYIIDTTHGLLVNYTTSFYHSLQTSMVSHYRLTRKNLAIFYAVLAVVEIVSAIFFAVVSRRLVTRKRLHAFDIIKTAQPPIMASIASTFDGVLTSERQKGNLKVKRLPGVSIQFALMFLALAIYPSYLHIRMWASEDITPNNVLYPVVLPTIEIDYVTYLLALVEFRLYTLGAVNLTTEACYHKLSDSDFSNALVSCPLFDEMNIAALYATQIGTMGLSLAFFFWSIYGIYACKKMFRLALLLLKYFPGTAVQSNPMLNRIMQGESITSKEIHSFSQEINADIDDLEFFATVRFDDLYNITEIKGDIERIIGIRPYHVNDIMDCLIEKREHEAASIRKFFVDQTTPTTGIGPKFGQKPLTVAISPSKEVTLMFGKNQSLIIKDDTHHLRGNAQRRLMEKVSKLAADIRERKNKTVPALVFVAIKCEHARKCIPEILKRADSYKSLFTIDARMQRVIVASEQVGENDNDQGFLDARAFALEVMDTIAATKSERFKCVIHFGGPITFKSPAEVANIRCFGRVFDELRLLLMSAPPGCAWVSDAVCTRFQKWPASETAPTEVPITHDTTIKIVRAVDLDT